MNAHIRAFLKLVQKRFTENGLYILDKLEAALSSQIQLTLLCLIGELIKKKEVSLLYQLIRPF